MAFGERGEIRPREGHGGIDVVMENIQASCVLLSTRGYIMLIGWDIVERV